MPKGYQAGMRGKKEYSLTGDEIRLVRMFKALGNPQCFHIVETLAECQPCLTYEVVATTPLAQATVSQHLKVLQEAGLVRGEAEGAATCYRLDVDGVRWLKDQIEDWLPGCCVPRQEKTEGRITGWLDTAHLSQYTWRRVQPS